jgi:methyl acetate hydrolase
MVLNGGASDRARVLQPATILQMQRNQIGELNVPGIFSADASLTLDLPLPADNPHKWGLAWLINTRSLDTGRPAGSQMWAGITNCYYWIDPQNGVGGALMTQILPFADPVALPLFMQFEAEIYKSLR